MLISFPRLVDLSHLSFELQSSECHDINDLPELAEHAVNDHNVHFGVSDIERSRESERHEGYNDTTTGTNAE